MLEYCVALVSVQHLSTAEEHCKLHLVAFSQKFAGVIELDIQVVLVGFGPEPDFLQCSGVLMGLFTTIATLAFLLIQPLAVIHYPADRRLAVGSDLDKIQAGLPGLGCCVIFVYDTYLIV